MEITHIFSLFYENIVEKVRPDIKLIPFNPHFYTTAMRNKSGLINFDFNSNPEFTLDIIARYIDTYPLFVLDLNQSYLKVLGIEDGLFFAYPQGQVLQLSNQRWEKVTTPDPQVFWDNRFDQLGFLSLLRFTSIPALINGRNSFNRK